MARLLIADDDLDLLEMLAQELESSGYEVISACDGSEALDLVEKFQGDFQCILTDYYMPKMGGDDLAKEVQKKYRIPIVIMTGRGDVDMESLYQNGVSGILPKPIRFSTLVELLEQNIKKPEHGSIGEQCQRQALRRKIVEIMELQCTIFCPQGEIEASLKNISAGGIGAIFLFPAGHDLSVIRFNITANGQSVSGRANLRWKLKEGNMLRAGFQFERETKELLAGDKFLHELMTFIKIEQDINRDS